MTDTRVFRLRWESLTAPDTFAPLALEFVRQPTVDAARADFGALTDHLTRIEAILELWGEIQQLPQQDRDQIGIADDQGAQWQFSREIVVACLPPVVWCILESFERHPETADEDLEHALLEYFMYLSRHPAMRLRHLSAGWVDKMIALDLPLPQE